MVIHHGFAAPSTAAFGPTAHDPFKSVRRSPNALIFIPWPRAGNV